jgi:hypothetical protein
MIVTLLSTLIFIAGYTSLASLVMLSYIIYWVFQGIRLTLQDEITTLNLDIVPTVEEKYILQKSLLSYLWNNLKKKSFVPLQKIIEEKTLLTQKREKADEVMIAQKYSFHLRNYFILALLCVITAGVLRWNSPVLILFLFPACYGLWHISRRAYRMPYIYDMYALISTILYKVFHVFSRARKLQKTNTHSSVKMWEEPLGTAIKK